MKTILNIGVKTPHLEVITEPDWRHLDPFVRMQWSESAIEVSDPLLRELLITRRAETRAVARLAAWLNKHNPPEFERLFKDRPEMLESITGKVTL